MLPFILGECDMNNITLYSVCNDYINALYNADSEVRVSSDSLRPHLFTKVAIDNVELLLPLSSPKSDKKRAKAIVDEIFDGEKVLGYIEYHKMIPFYNHPDVAQRIEISDIVDEKYRDLLLKDYIYIRDKIGYESILKKTKIIYNARYNPEHYLYTRYLKKFGTDIYLLRTVLEDYLSNI